MAKLAVTLSVFVAVMVLLPIAALFWRAGFKLEAIDWPALRFTLLQAFLSALISSLLALPVARALARRHFMGKGLVLTLLGAPFLLPVIVVVLGIIAVFGRNGWAADIFALFGLSHLRIYGLHGVVLAHVFLNLPLATRMIYQSWQSLPQERFRLAQSLGFTPRDMFRHIERPLLREALPAVFATIFAICLTSFAVALTLGGGPRATTLELAIYQALRFDFDLNKAATTALVQTFIGALAALAAWKLASPASFGAGLDRKGVVPAPKGWHLIVDIAAIALLLAFLLTPIAAIIFGGLRGFSDLAPQILPATLRSISIAVPSAILTSVVALSLALHNAKKTNPLIEIVAALPLATSSLVLGTGLFVLILPIIRPAEIGLGVTFLVNSLMALPFCYRVLATPARKVEEDYGRLAQSLGLCGMSRLRYVTLPRLAQPLGFATGLAAALSMGDLGVIALFAAPDHATLPLVIQNLAGAYKMQAASTASVILIATSFALFWLFDKWGRYAQA